MTNCPACPRRQEDGLLCHHCCTVLEYELGDPVQGVAAMVAELETTLARQGKGELTGKGGLAHERNGFHSGASIAMGALNNTLTTWARDLTSDEWRPDEHEHPTVACAELLLGKIDDIRRHPDVAALHDEITSSVQQARSAIDRAANRTIIPVGPCPEEDEDSVPCPGEVFAFIPTEDERPSRMECKANPVHKWTTVQWMRTGKRILDTIEKRKQQAKDVA